MLIERLEEAAPLGLDERPPVEQPERSRPRARQGGLVDFLRPAVVQHIFPAARQSHLRELPHKGRGSVGSRDARRLPHQRGAGVKATTGRSRVQAGRPLYPARGGGDGSRPGVPHALDARQPQDLQELDVGGGIQLGHVELVERAQQEPHLAHVHGVDALDGADHVCGLQARAVPVEKGPESAQVAAGGVRHVSQLRVNLRRRILGHGAVGSDALGEGSQKIREDHGLGLAAQ